MPFVVDVHRYLEKDFANALERLMELLRIPSISTDEAYKSQTRQAASLLSTELESLGFAVQVRDTSSHPIVWAQHPGPKAGGPHPRVLYYGHYDVQPPGATDLWHSPPFEPTVVTGPHGQQVVARGAADDKGQIRTFLEAFRGWQSVRGELPAAVTVLLEGDEETGSAPLKNFLRDNAAHLRADIAIITDTNAWDAETPAITYLLRGLVYVQVDLLAADRDLHSGLYGGVALNPAEAMARVLGQLHDDDGRVRLSGFYDEVLEIDARERAAWEALRFDERRFLGDAGLTVAIGERGRGFLERLWARPTCDINGIWSGYTGTGTMTIIPAMASAKLSCRLVADQHPDRVLESIRQFFEDRTPPGCRWRVECLESSSGIRTATETPFMRAAVNALNSVYPRPTVLVGEGGSIPMVGWLKDYLGVESVLIGFGLEDDRIHSPNEKFGVDCLKRGILSQAQVLANIAAINPQAEA